MVYFLSLGSRGIRCSTGWMPTIQLVLHPFLGEPSCPSIDDRKQFNGEKCERFRAFCPKASLRMHPSWGQMCVPRLRECIYRTRAYTPTMRRASVYVGAHTEREGVFLDDRTATILSAPVCHLLERNMLTMICRPYLADCPHPETILVPQPLTCPTLTFKHRTRSPRNQRGYQRKRGARVFGSKREAKVL